MTENDMLVLARATADQARMYGFKHTAAAMQRVIDDLQISGEETVQHLKDTRTKKSMTFR